MGLLQSNLALTQRDNTWGRCSGPRSLSKRPLWVLRVLLRWDRLYLFSLHMLLDLGEERGSGARKGGRDLCKNEWGLPAFSVSNSSSRSMTFEQYVDLATGWEILLQGFFIYFLPVTLIFPPLSPSRVSVVIWQLHHHIHTFPHNRLKSIYV